MRFHIPPFQYFLYALPFVVFFGWLGLQNRPDPIWIATNALLKERCLLLTDVPDSLQILYDGLHQRPRQAGDSSALKLLSKPSLSTIEWGAFRDLVNYMAHAKNKCVILSGVTGVGATKQAKKAALMLTGSLPNILQIDCSPQFDIILHDIYIGSGKDKDFKNGELIQFWERCKASPNQQFVVILDNLDKINPETFFGPQLWEGFSTPRDTAVLGGKKVWLPSNCWLISVTHLGPGSYTEFNGEHFKRLGAPYILRPNPRELLAYMRLNAQKKPKTREDSLRSQQLRDTNYVRHLLFYFSKINSRLHEKYAEGYELGQGSNIRDALGNPDFSFLKNVYLSHVNGLHPEKSLRESDFSGLDYTIKTGGLEPHSNFCARQIQYLKETGYLVEITMVLGTALLTFLGGWWVFHRREQIIRRYGERTQEIYGAFEHQVISAEVASRKLEDIKREVDALVMRRQLNYTEGLYFLAFIEDKVKRIDFSRNVSETFLELFRTFMEDEVLTENEYQKLRQFLQTIRHKIPEELYQQFNEKVERTYLEQ